MTTPNLPPARVPVLIAGGGPVGLSAAMELSRRGVACAVVEPREEVAWLRPRAKTVSARTMEHFRRWGLAQALRDRAPLAVGWSTEVVFCTTLTGREIFRFRDAFGLGLTGSELVAEPGQQAPQPLVEQILRDAVRASEHAELVTGWRVTGAAQDGAAQDGAAQNGAAQNGAAQNGSGVRVTAEDAAGRVAAIEADYVIGADGSRSVVRAAIGARFEGSDDGRRSVNVTFRAPALAGQVPHGPAVQYWVLNPERPGLMGRLDLDGTWWCIANGVSQAAGEAHAASIVRAMTGTDTPVEVLATDAWTARMLLADRYGRGRMFLAGDAAHQNPPYGGHGFNTGIGDAVNLGWKLAAVLNGWAPASLLETYEAERTPVAVDTIAEAAGNMATLATELADPRLMGSGEEFTAVLPSARAAIQRTKDREFHSLDLVLGYSYPDSPITAAGAGERLPHRWLGPGDSLYDHLGPEFTLIRCGVPGGTARDRGRADAGPGESGPGERGLGGGLGDGGLGDGGLGDGGLVRAAGELGVPLTVLDLDDPGWAEQAGAPLVLVRPDQHVSWRGHATDDPRALIRAAVGHSAVGRSAPG